MPIQIIDNFDLNAPKAIDNRMVVGPTPSFYHNKTDIPNKYVGLRIWELPGAELGGGATNSSTNGQAYVWTGNTWIGENTTAIGGGAGTTLRIPYFSSLNSILDTDMRYDIVDKNYGLSIDPDSGVSVIANNVAKLKVDGNISISGKFIGSAGGAGSGIFDLNASNITVGTMLITRLGGGTNGWILTADTTNSASYKVPSSINVGSATQLQNTRQIFGQTFNGTQDVTGNIVFGTQLNKATITYPTNNARTLTVPSLGGNRTFSFLEEPQTYSGTKTFTANVIINYPSVGPSTPAALVVTGNTSLNGTLVVNDNVAFYDTFFISHSSTIKIKMSNSTTHLPFVTFGNESGNSPRIRVGSSAVSTAPSYTWFGDDDTGMYRPSAGVIGFTTNGVERMKISDSGLLVSTNVSNPFTIDGGSSGYSYITFKSSASIGGVSAELGYKSAATVFTLSNEIGKSFVFRTSQNNTAGGNVELKLALNNGAATAPPEFSANQAAGLFIYNGGWRNIHANSFVPSSDIRIKKDIVEYNDSVLIDIMKIKPITYDLVYDDDNKRYMGFSAQNLFEINPLLVSGDTSDIYGDLTDHKNILGLNTVGIIAMLTNAVKELNLKIKELESKK